MMRASSSVADAVCRAPGLKVAGLTCIEDEEHFAVTAVIDIPDDLYQKVSARVAALGRRVPEVTVELYERWLGDEKMASEPPTSQSAGEQWLENWFQSVDEAVSRAPAGPSARELLLQDRNRSTDWLAANP
jgi:hypothetical protein